MNQLKLAVDKLRGQLDNAVTEKRAHATKIIEGRKEEILGSTYYANATSDTQRTAIFRIEKALEEINTTNQIGIILHIETSFDQDEYPTLLSLLAESQPNEDNNSPAPKLMVSVKSISVPGASGILETENDIDNYLSALRTVLLTTLNDGKGIAL